MYKIPEKSRAMVSIYLKLQRHKHKKNGVPMPLSLKKIQSYLNSLMEKRGVDVRYDIETVRKIMEDVCKMRRNVRELGATTRSENRGFVTKINFGNQMAYYFEHR